MTSLMFALCLTLCLFLWISTRAANGKLSVRVDGGFISANAGDRVTLQCYFEGSAVMFYWYKQTVGQKPRLISTFYKHEKTGTFTNEFKNNSRFSLETTKGNNHLTILNLHASDSATYYCVSCKAYKFEFAEGITVTVKDSGLNIQSLVHQSTSETIQPGGSVTLNCTLHTGSCDGEHSVYWFKDSEESHPGIIYTHGDRNDQCERKPDTQTNTCIYNLSLKNLNVSDVGTYYCAVASCGKLLFGDATKLDFGDDVDSRDLVYLLSGALALTTILAALLALSVYKINKRNSCKCTEPNSQVRFSAQTTLNAEGDQDPDNLHYAAFRELRFNRATRQMDDTLSHCVYSTVKQCN
ncbi:immunoglobulin kappa light chain-like isoform X2 [Anabas testudineus]|uniref:immunoglobulin kappa light chain-like isoform X2 n=1 Tax=Anabas testudineus TaxID=64144 RepID=UPI000E455014|nr:immunoglobulin kappa light chain-like isoform X2 [Anabas testudineus]